MTVINPKSISGITSITMPSGADNVLTIHTTDGTERLRIDSSGNVKVGSAATISPDGDLFVTGVCTATTLSGAASGLTGALPAISAANLTNVPAANITGTLPAISAANLTNVPAANITGTLPAISAASLTNVPAANVVGVHTSLNVTGSTIVGAGVTISESGIEASGIGITCANINGGQLSGRRNLLINGAMMVAQRGTSSTNSGYHTIDRFHMSYGGQDEAPTQAQVDVASGTTPYTLGFRKAAKITNGNQTSSVGATDYSQFLYRMEAQDIANSGWNYTSSSSYITLSFWIKSSVSQVITGSFRTIDGTSQSYKFDTPTLSADTWTKVVKTIPGNSNITVANDTGVGLDVYLFPFLGQTYTSSNANTETWITSATDTYGNNMTTTWWTTNDATCELTGVQLEVGSQATPFEHRSYAEEIRLCYRYYYKLKAGGSGFWGAGVWYSSTAFICFIAFPVVMRTSVSAVEQSGTASHYKVIGNATTYTCNSVPTYGGDTNDASQTVGFSVSSGPSQGQSGIARSGSADSYLAWSAEL